MQQLISPAEYIRLSQTIPEQRHILCEEEIDKARSFANRKRQDEWLTGRICAKLAAMQYFSGQSETRQVPQPTQLQILSSPSGRPRFGGEFPFDLNGIDLSISHGAGYGIAVVADCRCGVDIQEPRDSLTRIREKFCTAEEEELLQQVFVDLTEIDYLTILWTAKEAAKKALSQLRMPGFLELIFTNAEPHAGGWSITCIVSTREFTGYPATATIAAELYQGYGIAICLNAKERHA